MSSRGFYCKVLIGTVAVVASLSGHQQNAAAEIAPVVQVRLVPTPHPAVPTELSAMWYAPQGTTALSPVLSDFVRGVRLLEDQDNAGAALPLLSAPGLVKTPLANYARYYQGLALLELERFDAADVVFGELSAKPIQGHLPEDAAFRQGEVKEAKEDFKGAVEIYDALTNRILAQPQLAWLKLGLAANEADLPLRSVAALQRVYYDYPTTAEADRAAAELDRQDVDIDAVLAPRELARADALFRVRRWTHAKDSYKIAKPFMTGLDKVRVDMRIAACDVSLGRYREGRDDLKPLLEGPFADEVNFHYVNAARGLKLGDDYEKLARAYVDRFPASPFADEVLNDLASVYIVDDEDAKAEAIFREIIERYPTGRFAERAAWRAGWWAYRTGRFDEAVRFFDGGSAQFPRSDYRPSWLYWSGRAAQQLGDVETGVARLRLAAIDYYNSYYGRLAVARLEGVRGGAITPTLRREALADTAAVPTSDEISLLLASGLNREAMGELQYAQRMWGDSPRLQATIALTHRRLGNLRAGINAMKRAYPQYLAAGGETLPAEILQVIFPVEHWLLLQKNAVARGLDPYLVAALVLQESNFDPLIKSHANAVGLMQVLPTTGRGYAKKLGVRPFSAGRLTDPEVNVRIGTQILADTIKKFGGVHLALAAYNAGDSRVFGWQRERPGMPQDEFIDDIPFPETQNYVKRILGTAEDYRRLYGPKK